MSGAAGQPGAASTNFTWHTLKVGAGGFASGIQLNPDGTGAVKTNSGGGYVRSSSSSPWLPVISTTSLPKGVYGAQVGFATPSELRIAPSNTRTLYMKLNGYVLKSGDFGASWSKTAFPQVPSNMEDPNAPNSGVFYPMIGIDPANANTVLAGYPGNTARLSGVHYSTDGGATWKLIPVSSIPHSGTTNNLNGYFLIAFDPSTTSGGNTPGIFVCGFNNGCYHTTTGPAGTWTSIVSGGPTAVQTLSCDQFGVAWVTDTNGNIWRWKSGTWTKVLSSRYASVATDPSSTSQGVSHVVAVDYNGVVNVSLDGGTTWFGESRYPSIFSATDIPWLGNFNYQYSSAGPSVFDPSGSPPFKLVNVNGIGIWSTTPPTSNVRSTAVTWRSLSAETETLVATWVLAPPGGKVNTFAWDREQFYNPDPNSYPSRPAYQVQDIIGAWGADWASSSPSTLIMAANSNNGGSFGHCCYLDMSGVSNDGGNTWTPFGVVVTTRLSTDIGSQTLCGSGCTALQGLNFAVNDRISLFRADDYSVRLNGTITAYNTGTGRMTVNFDNAPQSGKSLSNWLVHTIPSAVLTGNVGGCMAASTASNWIWIPTNNVAKPYYTTNGGVTWNQITIAGIPTAGTTGWGGFRQGPAQYNCAADRVLPNTYYLYNYSLGLYTCTISGTPSCAKTFGASPTGHEAGLAILKSVPGHAGHLFFSDNLGTCPGAEGDPLKRSIDGGAHWSTVMNGGFTINGVNAYGFGSVAAGQSYPTIYVAACSGPNYGIWMSKDNARTWTNLGYPDNNYIIVHDLDGDKSIEGKVYVGSNGNGFYYYGP